MEKRKAVIKNIAVSLLLNKRNALRPKTSEIFLEAAPFGGECGSKKQQTAPRILTPTVKNPTDADRSSESALTIHPAPIQPKVPQTRNFPKSRPGLSELLRVIVVKSVHAGAVTSEFNPKNNRNRTGCFPCSRMKNAIPERIAPAPTITVSNFSADIAWSARAEKIKGEIIADNGSTIKAIVV